MPYTRIQPKQIQLPIFSSDSGDLSFSDLTTGVIVNLNRSLTGNFNLSGSLLINNRPLIVSYANNQFNSQSGSFVFGGTNNLATGSYNTILGGSGNNVSGQYNVLLNGSNCSIGATNSWNTILAGTGASFGQNVFGAVILSDSLSAVQNNTNNSLLVNFASGVYFEGGPSTFNSDLIVKSSLTTITGDLYVNGTTNLGAIDVASTASVLSDIDVSGSVSIVGSLNVGQDALISGDLIQTGNAVILGDLTCSGTISGNVVTGNNIYFNNITVDSLNIPNGTATISGSSVATQDWVLTQGFSTDPSPPINWDNLDIAGDLYVDGTGYIDNLIVDTLNYDSLNVVNFTGNNLTVNSGLYILDSQSLIIGGGTAINKIEHGQITLQYSGGLANFYQVYTGSLANSLTGDSFLFTPKDFNQPSSAASQNGVASANIYQANSVKVVMSYWNSSPTIIGSYLLLRS